MGMDVYGKNPSSEEGQYFHNNLWYWRPLWHYCEYISPNVTSKVKYAQSNDGDGLDELDTSVLANDIKKSIEDGTIDIWAKDYLEYQNSLPLEDCTYCESTGLRTWEPGSIQNDTLQTLVKKCNVCQGEGSTKNWLCSYPFSIDNVKNFLKFLESSGGFEIW